MSINKFQKLSAGKTTAVSESGITDLTGDVTATGPGSAAATIANGAITNIKMANMAANTVKANATVGAAAPTDVSLLSTATASAVMIRDTNVNVQANNFVANLTSTPTAGATTNLTVASSNSQVFTGTLTQTVNLPSATTLASGTKFYISNQSSGIVTVNDNSGTTIQAMAANTWAWFTVITVATAAGTWDTAYNSGGGSSNGFVYQSTGSAYGGTNATLSFTGINNTVVGQGAATALLGGTANTIYGQGAGASITSGTTNTVIGKGAGGTSLTTNTGAVCIGNTATSSSGNNDVIIGNGAHSSNTGGNSVAIGNNASNTGTVTGGVAIGNGASTIAGSIAIGNGATSTSNANSFAIGWAASNTGANSIVIGNHSNTSKNNCFVVATEGLSITETTTAASQIAFGSANAAMKDLWLGRGAAALSGAPSDVSIQATGVVTTSNQVGAKLTISAGNGTGTGGSGAINFQTAPAGSTGAVANTLAIVGSISNTGAHTFGATSTAPSHIVNGTLAFNGSSSGAVTVQTQASAGTWNFNLPTTAGSAGQVLTSQAGGSTAMTWTTPTASAGNYAVTPQTTTYAIQTTDNLVLCSGSAFTVTLPTAVGVQGKIYIIKKTDSSLTNIITIASTSSQTFDGNSSLTLNTDQEQYTLVSDGANWTIIDHRWNMSPSTSVATTVTAITTAPTKPTTAGLIDQDSMVWWRDTAKTVIVEYRYNQHGATGSNQGSGNYLWLLPFTVDTTNISPYTGNLSQSLSNNSMIGNGNTFDSGSASDAYLAAVLYDSTHFRMQRASLGGAFLYAGSTGMAFNATTLTYWVRVRIPVSSWGP